MAHIEAVDSKESTGAPALGVTHPYDLPPSDQIVAVHWFDGTIRLMRFIPVQVRGQELSGPPPLDMEPREGKGR
jgi:hypothetical protein